MGAYGHTASHMYHDQTQGLIGLADLFCVSLGYRLLVQCMEHAGTGQFRHAGIPGDGHQFIHHHRIHNIGRNTDGVTDLPGQNTAQIGRMLALHTRFQIRQQRIRHGVSAAGNGFQHSAPSHHHVQGLNIKLLLLQQVGDDLLAEVLLIHDGGILADLLRGMPQSLLK